MAMLTFDPRVVTPLILIFQSLPFGSNGIYYTKTPTYLRKHWTTKVEHTSDYMRHYEGVANFGVTRRRCQKTTPYIHYVRTLVHDAWYPWSWEAGPEDIPSVTTWSYFLGEFIFYNERETEGDPDYEALKGQLPQHPTYRTFLDAVPLCACAGFILFLLSLLLFPLLGKVGVHLMLAVYAVIFNRAHRRFWRGVFIRAELSRRRIHRISDPFAVDHHMLEFQYLIPRPLRDTESEGEPIEIVEFQDTINVWIEDDSDPQIDQTKLHGLLYDRGEPIAAKINMYHGVRVNLRKQKEYRSEEWYRLEILRLKGVERRLKGPVKKRRRTSATSKSSNPSSRPKSVLGRQFEQLKRDNNPNITANMLLRRLSPVHLERNEK